MDDLTLPLPGLSSVAGRPVKACFDGGSLSSDAGVLVLREVEGRLDVAERLARCLDDPHDPALITHSLADMIRFRMLMIAAGYEDGNDAASLRLDPVFKMAQRIALSGRHLASQPTAGSHRLDAVGTRHVQPVRRRPGRTGQGDADLNRRALIVAAQPELTRGTLARLGRLRLEDRARLVPARRDRDPLRRRPWLPRRDAAGRDGGHHHLTGLDACRTATVSAPSCR